MLRLPRCKTALAGCRQRGPPGGSTRMTSASWSANSNAASGPARYWPKSMTRMPSSAAEFHHAAIAGIMSRAKARIDRRTASLAMPGAWNVSTRWVSRLPR